MKVGSRSWRDELEGRGSGLCLTAVFGVNGESSGSVTVKKIIRKVKFPLY